MEEEDKPECEQRGDKDRPLQLSDLQTAPPRPPAPPKTPKDPTQSKARSVRSAAASRGSGRVASRLRGKVDASRVVASRSSSAAPSRAESKRSAGNFASRLRADVGASRTVEEIQGRFSVNRKQQERGGRRKKKPGIYMTQTKQKYKPSYKRYYSMSNAAHDPTSTGHTRQNVSPRSRRDGGRVARVRRRRQPVQPRDVL